MKECADEVKSAADDIKNNVDRNMKESASKSATLIKKSKTSQDCIFVSYQECMFSVAIYKVEQNGTIFSTDGL